jgi:hypothetical protein
MPSKQAQIRDLIDADCYDKAFVTSDFLDIANYKTVKNALARLEKEGYIKRLIRGVYARPRYSDFLKEYIDPTPDEVVSALARNNRWVVAPSGDTALNALGLSTQIPARYEYVSSGPYKTYNYKGFEIRLLHRANRDFYSDLSLAKVMLIIQGLKALGKDRIDDGILATLQDAITTDDAVQFYDSTKYGTSWIFEVARTIKENKLHANNSFAK